MSDVRLAGLAQSLLVELHEPYHLHERLEIAIKYLKAAQDLLVQPESTSATEAENTGSNPVEISNNTTSYLSHDITFTPSVTQVVVSSCGVEGCSVAPWSNE